MIVEFLRQFHKDLDKLNHKPTIKKVIATIENVEAAISIADIANIKKIKGYENAYRIRIGNYRIGLYIDDNLATFARILHRKDIYKYFP